MSSKIVKFTDLEVWQQAHKFRLDVLRELPGLPVDYRFGLSSQLQRSVVSVGSNIAEGFGRQSKKEKLQYYRIARGSLVESQDQLMVVRDMGLLPSSKCEELLDQSARVHQLIHGSIRSLTSQHELRTTKYEIRNG